MQIKINKVNEIPKYNFNDLFDDMNVNFIDYKDGMLLVKTKRYWFFDIKNNKIFGPFKEASMFKNDLARVVTLENKEKYMKKDGSFNKYSEITFSKRSYSCNKLISKIEQELFIFDNNGRVINKISAKNAKDYSGSYSVAEFENDNKSYFKYINSFGEIADMRKYEKLGDFNEHLAIGKPFQEFKNPNSIIYHIFDEDLDIIDKFKAASIIGEKFVNGLCIITNWDSDGFLKFGYVNEYGKYQIPCIYDMAYDFSDGLARVKLDGKYGYIDENNNMLLHNMFDEAHDFINGLAAVKMNGLWHIINKKGEFVLFGIHERIRIFDDIIVFDSNKYLPIKELDKIYKVKISYKDLCAEMSFDNEDKRDKFYDEQIYKLNKIKSETTRFEDDSYKELFSQIERTIKTKRIMGNY